MMKHCSLPSDSPLADDLLHCGICLDRLQTPKSLPCLHTFCQECLSGHWEAQRRLTRRPSTHLSCPVCREQCFVPSRGVAGLPTDFKVGKLEALLASVTDTGCGVCASDSRASPGCHHCISCDIHLCTPCVDKHRANPLFVCHAITETRDSDDSDRVDTPCCTVHSRPAVLYCTDCWCPVCCVCVHMDHKDHTVVDSPAIHQRELHGLVEPLQEKIMLWERRSVDLQRVSSSLDVCYHQSRDSVEQTASHLIGQIQEKAKQVITSLTKEHRQRCSDVLVEQDKASVNIGELLSLQELTHTLLQQTSTAACFPGLNKMLPDMRRAALTPPPALSSGVTTTLQFKPAYQLHIGELVKFDLQKNSLVCDSVERTREPQPESSKSAPKQQINTTSDSSKSSAKQQTNSTSDSCKYASKQQTISTSTHQEHGKPLKVKSRLGSFLRIGGKRQKDKRCHSSDCSQLVCPSSTRTDTQADCNQTRDGGRHGGLDWLPVAVSSPIEPSAPDYQEVFSDDNNATNDTPPDAFCDVTSTPPDAFCDVTRTPPDTFCDVINTTKTPLCDVNSTTTDTFCGPTSPQDITTSAQTNIYSSSSGCDIDCATTSQGTPSFSDSNVSDIAHSTKVDFPDQSSASPPAGSASDNESGLGDESPDVSEVAASNCDIPGSTPTPSGARSEPRHRTNSAPSRSDSDLQCQWRLCQHLESLRNKDWRSSSFSNVLLNQLLDPFSRHSRNSFRY